MSQIYLHFKHFSLSKNLKPLLEKDNIQNNFYHNDPILSLSFDTPANCKCMLMINVIEKMEVMRRISNAGLFTGFHRKWNGLKMSNFKLNQKVSNTVVGYFYFLLNNWTYNGNLISFINSISLFQIQHT